MCTISWGINLSTNYGLKEDSQHNLYQNVSVINYLETVARKGEARGKDWIGVYSDITGLLKYNPYHEEKKTFNVESVEIDTVAFWYKWRKLDSEKIDCILVHNRAIPESEVQNDHTQPIETPHFVVIHNWIIANDEELFEQTNLKREVLHSQIDTEKFAWALEAEYSRRWEDSSLENVFKSVSEKIQWSFAFAIYNKETKEFLLTTNFQPLSYKIDYNTNYLYFSSLGDYLKVDFVWNSTRSFLENQSIVRLPSYSYLYISGMKTIKTWEIPRDELFEYVIPDDGLTEAEHSFKIMYGNAEGGWELQSKGLVLASWGLDTTVVAGIMRSDYNCKELTFLHFDYGHKVEGREAKALEDVVKFYWAKLVTIKLDFLKELFKDSPLMTGKVDETGKWMELALDYVPVRNGLFMLMAISYAEVNEFNYIWFGGNLSESMAYPDTTAETISKLNDLIPNIIKRNWNIKILDPLRDLLKHEIVAEWIRVNAPMNLTWSCYQDSWTWRHCGKCASCRLRNAGMSRNWLDIEGN